LQNFFILDVTTVLAKILHKQPTGKKPRSTVLLLHTYNNVCRIAVHNALNL